MRVQGKPYGRRKRAEILRFVERYDAQYGRGGYTAAAEKFGVSRMSIFNWQREESALVKKPSGRKASAVSGKERDELRATLKELDKKLAKTLVTLAKLRKETASLVDSF